MAPSPSSSDDSRAAEPERPASPAEHERLELEVAHWRGLYEKLVVDARANITDAEGQIEMAREHIHELVGYLEGARELEERLTREVKHWRGLYDEACKNAEVGTLAAHREIDQARETIRDLVAQVERAAKTHERLAAERDHWRNRAEKRQRSSQPLLPRLIEWVRNGGRAIAVPRSILDGRRRLSMEYLRGEGVEIGALHTPTPVPRAARVRYVDLISTDEQRVAYPELARFRFVAVDIIDDGETLASIEDDSLDFVIASHVLEHCENPLGTIRNHARKIRDGGVFYYVLPDRRHCFDAPRPTTPFEHLVSDDRDGPETSRRSHYIEYARLVDHFPPDEVEGAADLMEAKGTRIHFHVWDQPAAQAFWRQAQDYLGDVFRVEAVEFNQVESIAILRRTRG